MFITKRHVPRRTFLKSAGCTVALPLLDAMLPALGAQTAAKPVVRFGAIYHPHGNLLSQWTPQTAGPNFAFTPILSPFEKYRDRLTVVSGLPLGPTVQNGGHAVAPASYLTGNIQPKQTELRAQYDLDAPELVITLDPTLTALESAQRYFSLFVP